MIFFPVLSACLLSIKINLAFHLYAFSEFLKSLLRIFRYPKILFPPVERSFPELHSWRVYYLPWRFSLNPFADFTSHETSWYHDVMNPNLTSSWCRRCHMYTKVPVVSPKCSAFGLGKGKTGNSVGLSSVPIRRLIFNSNQLILNPCVCVFL